MSRPRVATVTGGSLRPIRRNDDRAVARGAGFPLCGRHVDPMLDHPALEGVARDAEQLRRFDDAPAFFERLQTE